MEWLDNWNKAMTYVEEHLEDDIDMGYIGVLARCSTFHFQRMFSYMTDISFSEYVRRRKMSKAAAELQSGQIKVLDLALKYGYESPTAFNRAFKSVHGIAPSRAREEGIVLKAYPPISFKITIKGEMEMNYRVEKKEAFRIVGKKAHFAGGIEESFQAVPLMWQEAYQENLIPKLCAVMNTEIPGIMGVSSASLEKEFDYYIAAASNEPLPEGLDEFVVPACSWAIFKSIGALPKALQNMQKRIVTEWLPTSGYEYANAPDIEVYSDGDQSKDDYECEVWLPVVPVK